MNSLKCFLLRGIRASIVAVMLMLTGSVLAQAPQAFKYQAVVRDSLGHAIASGNVSMRMSIIFGTPQGSAIYSEIHNVITSPLGLITLDIGTGIPVLGNFSEIAWGLGSYFIKIEVDPIGGNNFVFMGTSQLLSVPYALYAREAAGPPALTWAQLLEHFSGRTAPTPGMMVYVTDENRMIYFNGTQWVTTSEECFPPPSTANAGPDQIDVEGTSTHLQANDPKHGSGLWSIISQANGEIISISDYGDPNALLTTTGGNFVLQWTVSYFPVSIAVCALAKAGDAAVGGAGRVRSRRRRARPDGRGDRARDRDVLHPHLAAPRVGHAVDFRAGDDDPLARRLRQRGLREEVRRHRHCPDLHPDPADLSRRRVLFGLGAAALLGAGVALQSDPAHGQRLPLRPARRQRRADRHRLRGHDRPRDRARRDLDRAAAAWCGAAELRQRWARTVARKPRGSRFRWTSGSGYCEWMSSSRPRASTAGSASSITGAAIEA